jgi:hypothetical protein
VEQGIFTEEEFLEMGRVVKLQMKRGWSGIVLKGFAE